MAWQLIVLAAASLAASAVVMRHRMVLTFLGVAGVLWEAHVLLLTWIERVAFPSLPAEYVFSVGAVASLLLWLAVAWRVGAWRGAWSRKFRVEAGWRGKPDMIALVVTGIVLGAAWLIASRNAYDLEWVTHGFFNGDVATFVALTQRSMGAEGLVRENPFAGNGALEYPSLLHAATANVLTLLGTGHDWMYFLPVFTYFQILITVPMFFVLWHAFGRAAGVAAGGLALFVMMLSWESFVYPQSHFFLAALFVLMAALLINVWGKPWRQHLSPLGVAAGLGIILLFSNAVTGTAAVAMKLLYDGFQAVRPKISWPERLGWVTGALFWVVMFVLFTPGEGSLGFVPGFSYTAAAEMGRLALPLLAVLAGALLMFERHLFPGVMVVALSGLAFVTFVFSSRGIVVENSSRFFYHALLIGWPLAIYPLTRVWYWLKLTLIDSSRTVWEWLVGWGAVAILLGVALLPAAASVASTHDNLMFKDERRVTHGMRETLWWITENTDSAAVFIGNPEPPFAIPVYTGRSLLRSALWLSPEDRVYGDVVAAFQGNVAAQETVLSQADYLLLKKDEREAWEPLPLKKVFDINSVVIYQLR